MSSSRVIRCRPSRSGISAAASAMTSSIARTASKIKNPNVIQAYQRIVVPLRKA